MLSRRLAVLCALLLLAGCDIGYIEASSHQLAAYRAPEPTPAVMGRARFLFDDMSGLSIRTLETTAWPWKVVMTALMLAREADGAPAEPAALLQEFGFIQPSGIANWSGGDPLPDFSLPLGLVTGTLESPLLSFRIEVANISCAACHAGVTYDASGHPQRSVWLGQPNTSINFPAFLGATYRALRLAMRDPAQLVAAIRVRYPHIDPDELRTIETVVLPAVAERLAGRTVEHPLGYHAGLSGSPNGLAALKSVLGMGTPEAAVAERALVSIPDLGGAMLRSSLLSDGAYAARGSVRFRGMRIADVDRQQIGRLAGMVASFTVPAMGVKPRYASGNVGRAGEIIEFLASYEPPSFPGAIDRNRAQRGEVTFREACSGCHGTYRVLGDRARLEAFPNRLVQFDSLGTDRGRAALVTQAVASRINTSPLQSFVELAPTGGYVAPPLTGLWASAPYLHNGSVPTLWHLMHPEQRPARFLVGGHALDFDKVGIAGTLADDGVMRYAAGYRPWAAPSLYDAGELGQANGGHAEEFRGLAEAQKADLLEFLKLL